MARPSSDTWITPTFEKRTSRPVESRPRHCGHIRRWQRCFFDSLGKPQSGFNFCWTRFWDLTTLYLQSCKLGALRKGLVSAAANDLLLHLPT